MANYNAVKYDGFSKGSLTLIKTLTASSDDTLEFVDGTSSVVLDSTYKEYLFIFNDIHPSSDNAHFGFQVNAAGALYVQNSGTGSTFNQNIGGTTVPSNQVGSPVLARMNDKPSAPSGHSDNEWTYLQTDLKGSQYTTHGTTGMAQGNTTVGTDAMQLDEGTDGYDVACKRVDLMSDPNNAGHIYVGSADTIASDGSVGGIRLNAGDFYSLDINNLTHIWVEASEAGQELNFIYYT